MHSEKIQDAALTAQSDGQLKSYKRQLEELTAEVARNDDKMRRSQQRELRLLQATDLQSLLQELLSGLQSSYGLQYVSLVICDPEHELRHLLLAGGSPVEGFENLLVVESLSGLAPQYMGFRPG